MGLANPQKENGYTAIANEILEALARTRIPGQARQVLDAILRRTYGWNKKRDLISLSQLSQDTGLSRQHVLRARDKLIVMNIVDPKKGTGGRLSYSLQKDYTKWRGDPNLGRGTPKRVQGDPKKGTGVYPNLGPEGDPKKGHTKDKYKDSIKTSSKDNRHQDAVSYWHDKYLKLIGFKYVGETKDFKHIKELLVGFTDEQYCGVVDYMMATDDL